jgi:hypothetical protein
MRLEHVPPSESACKPSREMAISHLTLFREIPIRCFDPQKSNPSLGKKDYISSKAENQISGDSHLLLIKMIEPGLGCSKT